MVATAINFIPPAIANQRAEEKKKQDAKTPQQKCEEKGGFWDPVRQTCLLAPPKVETTEPLKAPEVKPEGPETFTDVKTGDQSGVIDPRTGNVFLGLSPEEVNQISQSSLSKTQQPAGTAPVGTAQAQANQKLALQQATQQIGQIGPLTEATQADINYGQALTAGTIGSIPSILGSAAGGLAGGAVVGAVGGPIGAAGGAALGAVAGIVRGILGNIKTQQKGELQAANIELKDARTNMRQLAMLASQDPTHADYYIGLYNEQLTRVHQARRQTKAEVQGNLNSFMEDGRKELADFDSFLRPGGIADIYGQKLQVSLVTDVPLTAADLYFESDEVLQ